MTTKNTACELRAEVANVRFMLDNPITRFILTKTMLGDLRKQFKDLDTRSAVLGISGALELVLIHLEELLGEDTTAEEDQDDDLDELLTALLKTLL